MWLLHSLIESIKKQTTVAEYKLFALKKYVPRNDSPDLQVARNIMGQISIVQQYEQEKITRMIVILKKTKNKFWSSVLLNSTKTTTTGAEKKSPNLHSPDHAYA